MTDVKTLLRYSIASDSVGSMHAFGYSRLRDVIPRGILVLFDLVSDLPMTSWNTVHMHLGSILSLIIVSCIKEYTFNTH